MAQFFATIQGAKGPTSRLGTAYSGIITSTKSWQGEVNVSMYTSMNQPTIDFVRVTLGAHNHGPALTLYDGPAGGWQEYLSAGEMGRMAWFASHTSLRLPTPVTTE
jgi:hypothetical protein